MTQTSGARPSNFRAALNPTHASAADLTLTAAPRRGFCYRIQFPPFACGAAAGSARLAGRIAAIDRDRRTSDLRGSVGRKEGHERGYFRGRRDTASPAGRARFIQRALLVETVNGP